MLQRLVRVHWYIFTVTLGFVSVVEWAHCRRYINSHNWFRVVLTGIAAISSGYMASESLERDFPSWRGYGY